MNELVGYDFDGTLIELHPGAPWGLDGPENWTPTPILHNLQRIPGRKVIITGRTKETATGIANYLWGPPGYTLVEGVHAQEKWAGDDAMIEWKAERIKTLGCDKYIGDLEADRQAAALADVQFIDAATLIRSCRLKPPRL